MLCHSVRPEGFCYRRGDGPCHCRVGARDNDLPKVLGYGHPTDLTDGRVKNDWSDGIEIPSPSVTTGRKPSTHQTKRPVGFIRSTELEERVGQRAAGLTKQPKCLRCLINPHLAGVNKFCDVMPEALDQVDTYSVAVVDDLDGEGAAAAPASDAKRRADLRAPAGAEESVVQPVGLREVPSNSCDPVWPLVVGAVKSPTDEQDKRLVISEH